MTIILTPSICIGVSLSGTLTASSPPSFTPSTTRNMPKIRTSIPTNSSTMSASFQSCTKAYSIQISIIIRMLIHDLLVKVVSREFSCASIKLTVQLTSFLAGVGLPKMQQTRNIFTTMVPKQREQPMALSHGASCMKSNHLIFKEQSEFSQRNSHCTKLSLLCDQWMVQQKY